MQSSLNFPLLIAGVFIGVIFTTYLNKKQKDQKNEDDLRLHGVNISGNTRHVACSNSGIAIKPFIIQKDQKTEYATLKFHAETLKEDLEAYITKLEGYHPKVKITMNMLLDAIDELKPQETIP